MGNTYITTPHLTTEQVEADGGKALIINQRTIEYFVSGDEEGTPVVWIHGAGSTGKLGIWVGDRVKSMNFKVISVSLPGWGGTSPVYNRGYFEGAQDIVDILDHLKIDSFHVMGISYGSGTAAALAELVPKRILSLQIIAPAWPSMGEYDCEKHGNFFYKMTTYFNDGRDFSFYMSKIPMDYVKILKSIAPKDVETMEKDYPGRLEATAEDYARSKKYHQEGNTELIGIVRHKGNEIYDKIDILKSLGSKVSIWFGLEDTIAPPDNGKYISSILPDAKVFTFEKEGHLSILMDWTKFMKEMQNHNEK